MRFPAAPPGFAGRMAPFTLVGVIGLPWSVVEVMVALGREDDGAMILRVDDTFADVMDGKDSSDGPRAWSGYERIL